MVKNGTFICTRFLDHLRNNDPYMIFTDVVIFYRASNVHLDGENLKIHYPKITVMRWVEHTIFYLFIMLPKYQLWIRRLQIMRKCTIYLVLAYITNLILYSNQNIMNFTTGTLVYSVAMKPRRLVVLLEYTETRALKKHFLTQFLLMNSSVWASTENFLR